MTKKILLLAVITCFITSLQAQSNKSTTAYAITASQKGYSSWKDIRLVDIKTGEEIQSVFTSGQEIEILNVRTGKPVQKKDDIIKAGQQKNEPQEVFTIDADHKMQRVTNNAELDKLRAAGKKVLIVRGRNFHNQKVEYDMPFATNSAALAYDKKHNRLYYTPMGINQLRYIDLKSKTPRVYYFEDEAFGTVQNQWDVPGQITRMVIASDGNGYALSNDANHLIRFTTGKKPEITDLGPVTDDAASADFSIHRGVGGDMIADDAGNLYLVTAYRNVFKINIETRVSEYKGSIKGLPENYQTNGAAVVEGNMVVVCSGRSTAGYYRFDLNTLQAEKNSTGEVYNASDLANANLASAKKEKKEKPEEKPTEEKPVETITPAETLVNRPVSPVEVEKNNSITVYPNPVTDGLVKLSFNNQPAGKYSVQLMDLSGKMISNTEVVISSKTQVQEIRLPNLLAKGNYLIRVTGADNRNNLVTKLTVQ